MAVKNAVNDFFPALESTEIFSKSSVVVQVSVLFEHLSSFVLKMNILIHRKNINFTFAKSEKKCAESFKYICLFSSVMFTQIIPNRSA